MDAFSADNVPPMAPDYIANAEPTIETVAAVDYRQSPNTGGSYIGDQGDECDSYAEPNHLGTAVRPFPDNSIHGYDLPDELRAYDQMSTGTPARLEGWSSDREPGG